MKWSRQKEHQSVSKQRAVRLIVHIDEGTKRIASFFLPLPPSRLYPQNYISRKELFALGLDLDTIFFCGHFFGLYEPTWNTQVGRLVGMLDFWVVEVEAN